MWPVIVGIAALFLVLAIAASYIFAKSPSGTKTVVMSAVERPAPKEFTCAELRQYTGENGTKILVGVDGIVFNMSSHEGGPAFYGPGGGYHVFAGKDASVGLATMQLEATEWHKKSLATMSAAEKDIVTDWVNRFRVKYEIAGSLIDGFRPTTLEQLKERGLLH